MESDYTAKAMKMLAFLLIFVLALFIMGNAQDLEPATHFIHGLWFNGKAFTPNDFYAVNGLLTHTAPAHLNATVNLQNHYVVPPFGDAHEHNFDSVSATPAVTAQYLHDGIFYAQGVTDITTGAAAVVAARLVNQPSTVDVTYAHGGITGINGHPKDTYERYGLGIYSMPTSAQQVQIASSHLRAGNAYWEIDTAASLDTAWPKILAAKPDLIKVYLSESEHFAQQDHAHPPLGKGLDPALVPLITAKAHAAGLKVAAHIDTAADFHNALIGNVDETAHLPGYCLNHADDPAHVQLSDADIALAAERKIKVIPTTSICDSDSTPVADRAATRTSQLDNLRRLKQAGVTILIGSDSYGSDSLHEATYLHGLDIWTNLELLNIWCTATPQDIFPHRPIGELREGYAASFLVLASSPITDWKATAAILDRWKDGTRLSTIQP